MTDDVDFDASSIEAYVDAAAALQGLQLEAAWRRGVVTHFAAMKKMADFVLSLPLTDEVESAPIFTP